MPKIWRAFAAALFGLPSLTHLALERIILEYAHQFDVAASELCGRPKVLPLRFLHFDDIPTWPVTVESLLRASPRLLRLLSLCPQEVTTVDAQWHRKLELPPMPELRFLHVEMLPRFLDAGIREHRHGSVVRVTPQFVRSLENLPALELLSLQNALWNDGTADAAPDLARSLVTTGATLVVRVRTEASRVNRFDMPKLFSARIGAVSCKNARTTSTAVKQQQVFEDLHSFWNGLRRKIGHSPHLLTCLSYPEDAQLHEQETDPD